jgi:hypothetical protein
VRIRKGGTDEIRPAADAAGQGPLVRPRGCRSRGARGRAIIHELVELGLVLGIAQALQEGFEGVLLLLETVKVSAL